MDVTIWTEIFNFLWLWTISYGRVQKTLVAFGPEVRRVSFYLDNFHRDWKEFLKATVRTSIDGTWFSFDWRWSLVEEFKGHEKDQSHQNFQSVTNYAMTQLSRVHLREISLKPWT